MKGGARPGAGRPAGTPNKDRRALIEQARKGGGKTPEMAMLHIARILEGMAARYQPSEGNPNADEKRFLKYLEKAAHVYAQAAPYFAYKLQALKVNGDPVDLSVLSDEQLHQLIAIRAALDDRPANGGITTTLQ